ncbi:hypothetical protein N7532_011052 [Penicillium argentinense]|uniref:Uncharacterized protein n=1 Tax=Penicillium argentinense TaxID=1131581 RepID=A0A9W9EHP7_9EURO|nr:uncharacterized protein N7532_011052 [Penicillium argentinense]KAJ5082009.1 hypothetical protein N7532_011052 [Penicillium argentinense]
MDDTSGNAIYKPSQLAHQLFFTDANAAEDPDAQPWRDTSIDRLDSQDNTSALLTESVASSRGEAQKRGTFAERLTAIAALISIADRLRGPNEAQIERDLAKLGTAQAPLLFNALRLVDKSAADAYKARLGG